MAGSPPPEGARGAAPSTAARGASRGTAASAEPGGPGSISHAPAQRSGQAPEMWRMKLLRGFLLHLLLQIGFACSSAACERLSCGNFGATRRLADSSNCGCLSNDAFEFPTLTTSIMTLVRAVPEGMILYEGLYNPSRIVGPFASICYNVLVRN